MKHAVIVSASLLLGCSHSPSPPEGTWDIEPTSTWTCSLRPDEPTEVVVRGDGKADVLIGGELETADWWIVGNGLELHNLSYYRGAATWTVESVLSLDSTKTHAAGTWVAYRDGDRDHPCVLAFDASLRR